MVDETEIVRKVGEAIGWALAELADTVSEKTLEHCKSVCNYVILHLAGVLGISEERKRELEAKCDKACDKAQKEYAAY